MEILIKGVKAFKVLTNFSHFHFDGVFRFLCEGIAKKVKRNGQVEKRKKADVKQKNKDDEKIVINLMKTNINIRKKIDIGKIIN